MGYVRSRHQQSPSQQDMGTAVRTAKTCPASWDAFSDIDAFVDEVLVELAAMAGTRPTRSGPKPALTGAALRKAIMAIWCVAIWCVAFCGMQWRAIGQLCDIPFSTLYTLFAPGLVCGAACSTAWSWPGGRLAAILPTPAPSSSTADPVSRRRLASRAALMAARRSKASRSISRSINTASRWRSGEHVKAWEMLRPQWREPQLGCR